MARGALFRSSSGDAGEGTGFEAVSQSRIEAISGGRARSPRMLPDRRSSIWTRLLLVAAWSVTTLGALGDGRKDSGTVPVVGVVLLDFPELIDASRGVASGEGKPSGRPVPVQVHLPPGDGPFPVIVVSHGAGGDRETHFGQAQDLALHGYAVLCVEHVGSNRDRLTRDRRPMKSLDAMIHDAQEVLARPKDISFAIDQASRWNQSHEKLKGKLDMERVGAMGHSFGAYTTMVVCGMRPALDWLVPRVEPGKGLGPDLRDPRVKCGVALSPQGVGEPFFLKESFASLQVPLLGISGTKDAQQAGQPAVNRKEAFALWPKGEHLFVWLSNARHADFTSASGRTGRSLPSPTREDAQPVTRAATQAFFDLHLRSQPDAAKRLAAQALRPLLRGGIDSVEVLSK